MIETRISLKSANGPHRDRVLGVIIIGNVGGTEQRGTYSVAAGRPGGRIRETHVTNFPRRSKSALELLRRALNALHEEGNLP